jgi:putative NIF3 family GTP cyclohydrolase 1 type 2
LRLGDIYTTAVEKGISEDPRGRDEVQKALEREHAAYEKLSDDDKAFFDEERLTNPYADTRIVVGDPDLEVRGLITGVDMEVGELLLADRLRERGEPIDLVLAHHPEGPGFANLDEVMRMQADLWSAQGVGLGAADALIMERAREVRQNVMPYNHYRTVHAAERLDLALMSCHTPSDNCVTSFVQRFVDDAAAGSLEELVKALRTIPEYEDAARKGYGPEIVAGEASLRPGRTVVDMTGGTEGPKEALDKLSAAGVGTLVGMHYSKEHIKHAGELKLNLVIAGHISSDAIGMNLVLDEIESQGVEVTCVSGIVRVRR